jgi:hypothetical protein
VTFGYRQHATNACKDWVMINKGTRNLVEQESPAVPPANATGCVSSRSTRGHSASPVSRTATRISAGNYIGQRLAGTCESFDGSIYSAFPCSRCFASCGSVGRFQNGPLE